MQDYVPGKTINLKDALEREAAYEPTMRVLVTAWHDGGKTRVKCHAAYYKVPNEPADGKIKRESTVSAVHGKGPQSAVVPDDDRTTVFTQLEQGLPALMRELFTTPSHEFAREFLSSGDEGLERVGLAVATSQEYFDRPEDKLEYPADIADLVFGFRRKSEKVQAILARKNLDAPALLYRELTIRAGELNRGVKQNIVMKACSVAIGIGMIFSSFGMIDYFTQEGIEGKADRLFDDRTAVFQGLKNLRIASFSEGLNDIAGINAAIAGKALAHGYGICDAGRWETEAESLVPALELAIRNPDETFLKVDFNKTETTPPPFIEYKNVTDTIIYGTACPKP